MQARSASKYVPYLQVCLIFIRTLTRSPVVLVKPRLIRHEQLICPRPYVALRGPTWPYVPIRRLECKLQIVQVHC